MTYTTSTVRLSIYHPLKAHQSKTVAAQCGGGGEIERIFPNMKRPRPHPPL